MVLADRPEVRAVAEFLATPEGIQNWIRAGSAISTNTTTPADWYAGAYKLKVAAEIANSAAGIGFDASDLMPGKVGAGTFWTETVQWANANGANTDAVLKAIDDSWPPSNVLMACGARHLTVARPATISARRRWMAVARTESPGLSRFILPIAGLIGLGLCVGGVLVLLDPQGGPNLLASIYDALGNTRGRARPAQRLGRSSRRQAPAGGDRPGGRRRRHLAAVHRRRRAGQPAAAEVARPDPAVGLRRPRPGAAWRSSWSIPRRGPILRGFQDERRAVHARELRGDDRARVHRDPAQQRPLADRRDRRQRRARAHLRRAVRSRPTRVAGQDHRRSCRWRSRSSARRSSGASSTPGSPPASRRSGLLNAIVVAFGGEPIPWLHDQPDQRLPARS